MESSKETEKTQEGRLTRPKALGERVKRGSFLPPPPSLHRRWLPGLSLRRTSDLPEGASRYFHERISDSTPTPQFSAPPMSFEQ